jgi:hypothetical protein
MFLSLTDPELFGIIDVRILKVVDLPAPLFSELENLIKCENKIPLGPNKPNISPYLTPKELFLTA